MWRNNKSFFFATFRCQHETRKFNKGAMLALLWTLVSYALVTYPFQKYDTVDQVLGLLCGLSFPIIGYLSDVYVGRYKVIRYSIRLIFVFLIIDNLSLISKSFLWNSKTEQIIEYVVDAAILAGLTGVLANTIQFGVDQLVDSPATSVMAFLSWYCWTFSFASVMNLLSQNCFCGQYTSSTSFILFPILFTVAITSDICMSKWLLVEPVTNNPFRLIYQVLKYAAKNKYPRLRSAFTYWEDKPYSRIDLGKAKYGGPFTTEQVEDVKTLFRLLPAIGLFSLVFGEVFVYSGFTLRMSSSSYELQSCSDTSVAKYFLNCYKHTTVKYILLLTVFFLVPILEFLVYPLLHLLKCHVEIGALKKFYIGAMLVLMVGLCHFTIETVNTLSATPHNATCYFFEDEVSPADGKRFQDDNWQWAMQTILGIAVYILFTSTLELVCAQSPYSMKGLLIGVMYFNGVLSLLLSFGFVKVIQIAIEASGERCGIWFYLVNVSLTFVVVCSLVVVLKCYTFRKRDDTLSNDQMFAVDYFNKYLSSKPSYQGNTSRNFCK